VRTLEECYWVGMPAKYDDVTGELVPIAVVIPWEIKTIDNQGKVTTTDNPDFNNLVLQEFDEDQALITMCRSGGRSTYAAERLESLDFTNVYELDNALTEIESYPGGKGGFQGSNYKNTYGEYAFDGYRGHPERLPENNSPWKITVETVTEDINNAEDSVSWKDTGLPITQKVDPSLIPTLE
jgi:rhodanese-related sulfurtransferase